MAAQQQSDSSKRHRQQGDLWKALFKSKNNCSLVASCGCQVQGSVAVKFVIPPKKPTRSSEVKTQNNALWSDWSAQHKHHSASRCLKKTHTHTHRESEKKRRNHCNSRWAKTLGSQLHHLLLRLSLNTFYWINLVRLEGEDKTYLGPISAGRTRRGRDNHTEQNCITDIVMIIIYRPPSRTGLFYGVLQTSGCSTESNYSRDLSLFIFMTICPGIYLKI